MIPRAPLLAFGASAAALPPILEIKRTLTGGEKRFACRQLHQDGAHLVVLFVAGEAMNVHGVELPAGMVTFGHFWRDRPYNVYHWLDGASGKPLGAYVNLAAETRFEADQHGKGLVERVEWLDLVLDVLVLPGQAPRVLDEDELAPDTAPGLRSRIDLARAAVMAALPALLEELEAFRARTWQVGGTPEERT